VSIFVQAATWDHETHGKGDHRMYDRAAQRLLLQRPEMARHSLIPPLSAVISHRFCGSSLTIRQRPRREAALATGRRFSIFATRDFRIRRLSKTR
jgi:hypothetical protein